MPADFFVFPRDLPLVWRLARQLGRVPSRDVVERLGQYLGLVAAWNRKIGLTSAQQAHSQVEVMLADALVLADAALVPQGARMLDVGSGAGAPAVPLALARPDVSCVLLEPKQKRVAFLHTVIGTLRLADCLEVRCERLQEPSPQIEGQPFDVAMSRATFRPEVWLTMASTLARRTLVFTAATEPPPPPVGVRRDQSCAYRLPSSGAQRRITAYLSST